jgi:hypothetical protein
MPERLRQIREIDAVCLRFEQSWKDGAVPRIEEELAMADPEDRADLLAELLPLEWVYRRSKGHVIGLRDYRDRFPGMTGVVYRLWNRWLEDNGIVAEARDNARELALSPDGPTWRSDDFHFPAALLPSSYEQLEPLGRGGMGIVYRAFDPRLRRRVALKRLHTVSVDRLVRLQREAEALARLQHPHIVTIHGWEELSGQPVLVLEYVMGGSLEDCLRDEPLSAEDSVRLLSILARAVQAAHDIGIVHRDLKPANVLLAAAVPGSSGTVAGFFPKVSDFGLACIETNSELSECGAVVGTADYMSPEQVEGRSAEIGPATDVWALGVILYRCLTCSLPFSGGSVLETLERVRSGEYTPPRDVCPDLSEELTDVCERCLEKDLARRPSAGEMADLLDKCLALGLVGAQSGGGRPRRRKVDVRTRTGRASRSRRLLVAGFVAAGLLVVLASGWLMWPNQDTSNAQGITEAVAAIPSPEPVRIVGFRVQHLRIKDNLADDLGQIGEKSFELRFGDSVNVDVKLSRPAYLYLVALNADGKEQLLWPMSSFPPKGGDPWTVPQVVKYLHYPPVHPRTGNSMGLTMNDETAGGLQAIALLVSASPLPPYADYQSMRGQVGWKKQLRNKGVWLADTEGVYPVRRGVGVVRGEQGKLPDVPPLLAFARQLKVGGVDLVEILAFPVGAKEGK